MKFKNLYIITLLLSFGFLSACEKDAPEVEYTATYPVSGEWWVKYEVETSPGVFQDIHGWDYSQLLTFNTAANLPTEIWITDNGHFRAASHFKVKPTLNMQDLTFSGTDLANAAAATNKITITDGKVLTGAGRSSTGVVTDSIHFRIAFGNETVPGRVYRVSGHRRTGFLEDEH